MKRWAAIGCTHGDLIDHAFTDRVLAWKDEFRPQIAFHLGDAFDFACLRKGVSGQDPDYTANLRYDVDAGLNFLAAWFKGAREKIYTLGNHENRVYKKARQPGQEAAWAAEQLIAATVDHIERRHKATVIPYRSDTGFYRQGDTAFLHGYRFNVHAARATAQKYGKSVFVHTHRFAIQNAEQLGNPVAYNIGCGLSFEAAGYAHERPGFTEWAHGFAFGFYNEKTGENTVYAVREGADGSLYVPEGFKRL